MGGVYVYPRFGAQGPGTGQRWIGGFGFGAVGDLGCACAGPALSGIQTYRPIGPGGGWIEMSQVMPQRAGVMGQYGSQRTLSPAEIEVRERMRVAAMQSGSGEKPTGQPLTVGQAMLHPVARATPADIATANAALIRAGQQHARAGHEQSAEAVAMARAGQIDARLEVAEDTSRRLANALANAERHLAGAQSNGNPAAAEHWGRVIAHLKAVQAKVGRTQSHVAGLHQRMRAMKTAMAKPTATPVFTADSAGLVGPSIPAPAAAAAVMGKSAMADAAPVVASPVMQGYAGFGEADPTTDAAALEAQAAEAVATAETLVGQEQDPIPALATANTALTQAAVAQGAERSSPLVPGMAESRGTLLMWGMAAGLLFLLARRR